MAAGPSGGGLLPFLRLLGQLKVSAGARPARRGSGAADGCLPAAFPRGGGAPSRGFPQRSLGGGRGRGWWRPAWQRGGWRRTEACGAGAAAGRPGRRAGEDGGPGASA